jgi:hypothetical protein
LNAAGRYEPVVGSAEPAVVVPAGDGSAESPVFGGAGRRSSVKARGVLRCIIAAKRSLANGEFRAMAISSSRSSVVMPWYRNVGMGRGESTSRVSWRHVGACTLLLSLVGAGHRRLTR